MLKLTIATDVGGGSEELETTELAVDKDGLSWKNNRPTVIEAMDPNDIDLCSWKTPQVNSLTVPIQCVQQAVEQQREFAYVHETKPDLKNVRLDVRVKIDDGVLHNDNYKDTDGTLEVYWYDPDSDDDFDSQLIVLELQNRDEYLGVQPYNKIVVDYIRLIEVLDSLTSRGMPSRRLF